MTQKISNKVIQNLFTGPWFMEKHNNDIYRFSQALFTLSGHDKHSEKKVCWWLLKLPCLLLFLCPISVLLYWYKIIMVGLAISVILVSFPRRSSKSHLLKIFNKTLPPWSFQKRFSKPLLSFISLIAALLVVCLYATTKPSFIALRLDEYQLA